jgi:FkbH-like protein
MTNSLYTGLSWLPAAPPDFRQRCNDLPMSAGSVGRAIAELARYSLDESQLKLLAKAIARLQTNRTDLAPLTPFRLGILGNGTLDLLTAALTASAARFGIALECVTADYDQVLQPATTANSALHAARPDAVLLSIDYRGLPWRLGSESAEGAEAEITGAVGYLATIRSAIRAHSNVPCIIQTLAPPAESLFGSLDRVVPGTVRCMIDSFNKQIIASVLGTQDILLDVASIAATVGLAEWHSPTQWNLAKLPFAAEFLPLYADHVGRLIGAFRGKSRRCLILDLDNTLWGGVIGDDGLEGIQLAQGDGTGEAFLSVQRLAMELRARGVVLAVCSKNNEDVAREAFQHPEMMLKLDQIAIFQANWNDKATNIKAIAEELSLGLDAMVFLDDNPVERGLVRRILPEVAVPELPDDPALYARTLAAAGYFETIVYSPEDRARADFYQDNARRIALKNQAGDVNEYLASLDMTIIFQPFDAAGRPRISQLINKSNQFNLTTRRYSELEVAEAAKNCFTMQVRLADRFSDNGMISVVICREVDRGRWEIEIWLMSCRVLGRGVEGMVLREILINARKHGIRKLTGVYRPTARNSMVQDHYPKLGFTPAGTAGDGATLWEMMTDSASDPPAVPMRIRREGFETAKYPDEQRLDEQASS